MIRSDWPDIVTFNAMDVWQVACYLTVFASVAEFSLVIYLTKAASWEETLLKTKKVNTLNGKGEPKVICFTKSIYLKVINCKKYIFFVCLQKVECLTFNSCNRI